MATGKEITDQELLAAFSHGEVWAYELLFDRHWKELYRKAFARLKDDTFAEDIVQDVFLDLWERRETLRVRGSLSAYLAVALRNQIINWIGRSNLHRTSMSHILERMEQFENSLFDELAAQDLQSTLAAAVASLPTTTRRIFLLRNEQFTIREIAEALGLAEQTVKNKSSEALALLRQSLLKKHPDLHQSFFVALGAIVLN